MVDNPFSLEGKTIFITGASCGIGRAVAIECSKMGADLLITGRDKSRLDETFAELKKGNHQKFITELREPAKVENLVKLLPNIDGAVLNAGITEIQPVGFIKPETLQSVIDINTISPILMTNQLVKLKKMKKPSSIVFTSSVAGVFNSSVGNSIYSTSKGALHAFMKNAALELAIKGIRCNSVNPGLVSTKLLDQAGITQIQRKELAKQYPLKRLGHPEDVAHAIIYLLSNASNWVTGTSLVIDGGYTLH